MTTQPVPTISEEVKAQLKTDRLEQYKARIFNFQMDIAAYIAVGDTLRQEISQKNLDDLVVSYYAVEAMV